jgi:hypothetical protein
MVFIVSGIVTGSAAAPAGQRLGQLRAFFLPPGIKPIGRVMRFVVQVFHSFLVAPSVQVHQVMDFVGDVLI